MAQHDICVGVIGGSGLYKLEGIDVVDQVNPETPWGLPSSPITIGKLPSGVHIAFLARHGLSHQHTPSSVPALANISALKSLGVRAILAFSAVGSLREEIAPKDFVVPSQIIDRTKGIRRASFFGEGNEKGVVAHAGFGDPFDETLRPVVEDIVRKTLAAKDLPVKVHGSKTVVCMEGPAFSTRAESNMYRQLGGDIINMSVLPEAKLAREAELAYVLIATATDYDAWRASSAAVNVTEVLEALKSNVVASQQVTLALLDEVHQRVKEDDSPVVKANKGAMQFAIMTKPDAIPQKAKENLKFVFPEYF
ncbi:Methylthioadenosine phosphorylase [Tilletiaria anomala UBC 951]|uniref:S-methyl-5'-thioadenosine phosphorylase n=1 Tax=Tilletiaria anomala (strain ATCC 24038 / CBS 436.72 / UBC 951) TaxID=1037660 RepID=A0A066WS52_TILAU|nr:Methylthioadenosine phosphorylase [Tilletiaria anomala UBC 951]KDN53515.1 Methylthioadenosine phosphorylase [Tilletiaria anomala UBC 951]